MSATTENTQISILLEEIKNYTGSTTTNGFHVSSLKGSEGNINHAHLKQVLIAVYKNPKIKSLTFTDELWLLDRKELIEILELIENNFYANGALNSCQMLLWDDTHYQLKSDAEKWSVDERREYLKKWLLKTTRLNIWSYSQQPFPFPLSIAEYIALFDEYFKEYLKSPSIRTQNFDTRLNYWIEGCYLLKEEEHLRDKLKEPLIVNLFERELHSLRQGAIVCRIPEVNLNEARAKSLASVLATHKASRLELTLRINLTAENSNLAIFDLIFKAISNKQGDLKLVFDSKKETCPKKLREMIDCLASNGVKLSLELTNNDLHLWNFKEIEELVKYYKNTTQSPSIYIWYAYDFYETVKEWDESKKQAFLKLTSYLEAENNRGSSELLPFTLTVEEYRDFFIEFSKQNPQVDWKINSWLAGLKTKLTNEEYLNLQSEITMANILQQDHVWELQITPFMKSDRAVQRLNNSAAMPSLARVFQIKIELSNVQDKDLPRLIAFLNENYKLSAERIHVDIEKIEEKGQAEKLMLLLKQINNPKFKSLEIHNLSRLQDKKTLMEVLEAIANLSWPKRVDLLNAGLEKLSDEEFISGITLLLGSKSISDFGLSNNGIAYRNISVLQNLLSKVFSKEECQVNLWSQQEVHGAKEAQKWDTNRCLAFAQLSIPLINFSHFEHDAKPFYGLLDNAETFKLIKEYLKIAKKQGMDYKIRNWVKNFKFDYEQRKFLLHSSLAVADWVYPILDFDMNEEDRLQAYLLSCKKVGGEDVINLKGGFNLIKAKAVASPFLDPWDFSKFEEFEVQNQHPSAMLNVDDMEFDTLKTAIQTQLIPGLKAASEAVFGRTPFFTAGFNKIAQFKIRDGELHDLNKCLLLLQWYTWFMSSLAVSKADLKNFNDIAIVFKEIVDFADPEMRYQTAALLLNDIINNQEGYRLYHHIISSSALSSKEKGKEKAQKTVEKGAKTKYKTMTLIPALFLTKMILSEDETNDKNVSQEKTVSVAQNTTEESDVKTARDLKSDFEAAVALMPEVDERSLMAPIQMQKKGKILLQSEVEASVGASASDMVTRLQAMAIEILQSLSGDFGAGNKERAFNGALQALMVSKELPADKKLDLIKNLIGLDATRKTVEDELKQYYYLLKIKIKNAKITGNALKQDMKKILGEYAEAVLLKLPVIYQKLFAENEIEQAIDFTKVDSNALGRSISSSFVSLYHELETRRQMANWYLMQGLGLLNELKVLSEIEPSAYKTATNTIVKGLFQLNETHMQLYPVIFGGRRNEAALFTYLGKIRSLPEPERSKLEQRYRETLWSILSENSRLFYQNRYRTALNPHLAAVFTLRPELQNLWPQNFSMDFAAFIKQHDIRWKENDIDYPKFIVNKIFTNRHLNPSYCQDLKSYLEEKDEKLRSEIKQRLTKDFQEEQLRFASVKLGKPSPNYYKIGLQLELIELVETLKSDKPKQLKCIRNAIKFLRFMQQGYEFRNDLQSLLKNLESTNRSIDLAKIRDWKIVFTDDFWDLFMAGDDVEGSCQRVNGTPSLNKCLLSYVQDGKNKMLAIQDETGKTVARCIIRLLLDETSNKPILFMEELYPYSLPSEQKQALEKLASFIADDFDLILVSSEPSEYSSRYLYPIVSKHGMGPEYVDALHTIVPDGLFSITSGQMYHSPYAAYITVIEEWLRLSGEVNCELHPISQTVLDYLDIETESRLARPLHFQWKKAQATLISREQNPAVEGLGLLSSLPTNGL